MAMRFLHRRLFVVYGVYIRQIIVTLGFHKARYFDSPV